MILWLMMLHNHKPEYSGLFATKLGLIVQHQKLECSVEKMDYSSTSKTSTMSFIDFKKAFDRVWHAALWATMKKYNISTNLIQVIKNLYNKATSAVLINGSIGDWF